MKKRVEVTRKRWICGDVRRARRQAVDALNSTTWGTKKDLEVFAKVYLLDDLDPSKFARATITVTVEWEEKK